MLIATLWHPSSAKSVLSNRAAQLTVHVIAKNTSMVVVDQLSSVKQSCADQDHLVPKAQRICHS